MTGTTGHYEVHYGGQLAQWGPLLASPSTYGPSCSWLQPQLAPPPTDWGWSHLANSLQLLPLTTLTPDCPPLNRHRAIQPNSCSPPALVGLPPLGQDGRTTPVHECVHWASSILYHRLSYY